MILKSMIRHGKVPTVLMTLAVGTAGGAVFNLAGMPLPWMLGALTFTVIGVATHGKVHAPQRLRYVAAPVLGVLIGSFFTPDLVQRLGQWSLVILMAAILLACSVLLGVPFFRRFAGLDRASAFCASVPGGMTETLIIGASMGCDTRAVALAHLARIVVVVFTFLVGIRMVAGDAAMSVLPLAAPVTAIGLGEAAILVLCGVVGFLAGRRLRLPAAVLSGPMILSAAAHLSGISHVVPPSWLVSVVQVIIGTTIGVRFAGIRMEEARRMLTAGFLWGVILMLLSLSIALAGGLIVDMDIVPLVLALAPGGVTEMTLVSLALGIDIAFVSTIHVMRISMIAGLALPLIRLVTRRSRRPSSQGPPPADG